MELYQRGSELTAEVRIKEGTRDLTQLSVDEPVPTDGELRISS